MRGDIPLQLVDLDGADSEHADGIGVLGESQQQMLQRHLWMRLLGGIVGGPRQRLRKIARWRENLADLIDDRMRHRRRPSTVLIVRPAAPPTRAPTRSAALPANLEFRAAG